ncbi:MAG: hypothetical protein RL134_528 [Actinomycetota bacterium]|jgi:hypothetical protein
MSQTPEALRAVIREIVREVIREVVVEEMALGTPVPSTAVERTPTTSRRPEARPVSTSSESVHFASGALTERHLRALGEARVIRIGRKVVITPLARDWARSRGIDIIRIDG